MKAILIDDENKARRLLEALLQDVCPEITAIYQASDLVSGVKLIREQQPDIVFLDIEMPNHSGLQILELFDGKDVNFQIIFVTAYSQYAIEAFKLSAIDYLLKPLDVDEIKKAVDKVISIHEEKISRTSLTI
jgi:two-component system LytT family response regulator